jgi:hypothetical protein
MNPQLLEKIRKATERLEKSHCKILKPGAYSFTVQEAKIEHDKDRKYDFVFVKLDCGEVLTSDRFPIVDNMIRKLGDFLAAMGLDADTRSDEKDLIGRTGKLTAEKQADGKVFYRYGREKAVAV